jgi:hypothetical protein
LSGGADVGQKFGDVHRLHHMGVKAPVVRSVAVLVFTPSREGHQLRPCAATERADQEVDVIVLVSLDVVKFERVSLPTP